MPMMPRPSSDSMEGGGGSAGAANIAPGGFPGNPYGRPVRNVMGMSQHQQPQQQQLQGFGVGDVDMRQQQQHQQQQQRFSMHQGMHQQLAPGNGLTGLDQSNPGIPMGSSFRSEQGMNVVGNSPNVGGAQQGMNTMQQHAYGFSQEVSPSMQQRMSASGQGMYMGNSMGGSGGPSGQSAGGFQQGMSEMTERGGSGNASQGMATSTTGGAPNAAQAEREEELLLNLLIARRQRGRISGDSMSEGFYADELLRLRQGRASASQQGMGQQSGRGAGHTLPPMPGMGPLYMDQLNSLPAVSGTQMNAGILHNANGDYSHQQTIFKSDVAMNIPSMMQEGDQRIDRAPAHLLDARSQDMMMRDFSGRGMKRGNPYDSLVGHNMKYSQHPLPIHPHNMHPHQMQMHGMDSTQAIKKKRSHKKKPADMPRRPLSAYNLFFSEERERILKEIDGEKPEEKKDGEKTEGAAVASEEKSGEGDKPKALLRPLIPNQKKRRPHRKTHGKISFQQLARMVGERWKALDEDRRKYYQELAQEDMKRQKLAMEEYYAKQQAMKDGTSAEAKLEEIKANMETVAGGIPENSNTTTSTM